MVCIWPCSVWSLPGHYLVTTWLLPGHFLGPTWTLPGLTGTNMIPMLSPCCPYVIPTCSACSLHGPYLVSTWSLSVCYLICTWSLSGPIWSLCSPDFVCMVTIDPTWSLYGLPGPSRIPTGSWSLPGQFLINIWSIPGPFVVSMWSLPGLVWFLHDSYVFPTCSYMVYVVHTWSLPGPCPFLVPTWSLPDLAGPKIVPMYSLWTPNEVHMLSHMVPTWSAWSL
jgi:hypothetical protein